MQAAQGLGVLARGEAGNDSSDDDGPEKSSTNGISVLSNLVLYDPQADVRRVALPGISLPLNSRTLGLLLSRSRDPDKNVRRTVFKLLRSVPVRGLSLTQRSSVVRLGLGDREESVRADTAKLIDHWALSNETGTYSSSGPSGPRGKDKANTQPKVDLDDFLDLFDLWDGEIAEEALKALLYIRPYLLDGLDLSKGELDSSSVYPTVPIYIVANIPM